MPDTGAPWNIPYVEPTDNPRVYPQVSEDLADAIALGLSAAGNAGIGSNVVSVTKLDVFTTGSATFVDVTGLSVTITPSTATSKILLVAQLSVGGDGFAGFKLTGSDADNYIGNSNGSAKRAVFGVGDNGILVGGYSMVFLSSPATASPVTYKVQARRGAGGTAVVNRSSDGTADANRTNASSSLTAIEVAA